MTNWMALAVLGLLAALVVSIVNDERRKRRDR